VSLTGAGKVFQKYAEQTLVSRKAMLVSVAEMERVPRGEIVVGANEGTCLHILPEVFAEFKKLYPSVGVQISRLERVKIMESITDNSVDFGVVSAPVDDKRLTVVNIHRDELVIIVSSGASAQLPQGGQRRRRGVLPSVAPKVGRTRDAIANLFDERRPTPRPRHKAFQEFAGIQFHGDLGLRAAFVEKVCNRVARPANLGSNRGKHTTSATLASLRQLSGCPGGTMITSSSR